MARTNVKRPAIRTHEGAKARVINPEQMLRRTLMSSLLFEKQFYEDGVEIADRMRQLVPLVDGRTVAGMAVEARTRMNLRHAPLFIVRQMAQYPDHKNFVAETLGTVIQRADELAEFLSMYSADRKGRKVLNKLAKQVQKGLARAFQKFDEYRLAKYNQANAIKLRDVLFLCHAKPLNEAQGALWKRLIEGKLAIPDTWEVAISACKTVEEKKAAWTRLISEKKLGAMAYIRNLRNMTKAGVDETLVRDGLVRLKTDRVLPYRFISAARYAPEFEPDLEKLMLRNTEAHPSLKGKTVLLIDVSGSMDATMSGKSEMTRIDAACGLAILLREIGEQVDVYTFSNNTVRVPARTGFALRDAIDKSQGHGGTMLGKAIQDVGAKMTANDRLIVISDEQSQDTVGDPKAKSAYMINVASYRNGVGYGKWVHVDGFSESLVTFIIEYEKSLEINDNDR